MSDLHNFFSLGLSRLRLIGKMKYFLLDKKDETGKKENVSPTGLTGLLQVAEFIALLV